MHSEREIVLHTGGQTVYLQDHTPQTTSLVNLLVPTTPPGNRFMTPLYPRYCVQPTNFTSLLTLL